MISQSLTESCCYVWSYPLLWAAHKTVHQHDKTFVFSVLSWCRDTNSGLFSSRHLNLVYLFSPVLKVNVCPSPENTVKFSASLWLSVYLFFCFPTTWVFKLCSLLSLSFSLCSVSTLRPLFSLRLLCDGRSAVLGPQSPLAVGALFQMFWTWICYFFPCLRFFWGEFFLTWIEGLRIEDDVCSTNCNVSTLTQICDLWPAVLYAAISITTVTVPLFTCRMV